MSADDFLDAMLEMIKDIIESFTLPTGATLLPSFFISLGITVISGACALLDEFRFIDWRGGLVATLCLGVLVFIERRGMNEVSRLYRVAKSRVATVASRAKRPGACEQAEGAGDAGESGNQTE